MIEPFIIIIILLIAMVFFIWGRFRYDVVALLALMLATLLGAIPYNHIYDGLSNPAVITVACVMIISQSITRSGVLNIVVEKINQVSHYPVIHILVLAVITAVFSAFMNNVGALGLMMPIAIQTAIKAKRSPSIVLMPVALGSALGGLTTVIGTPPNLLISSFREQVTGHPFKMFDFAPVGFWTALAGVIFIAFIGWRLLPKRKTAGESDKPAYIKDYITELKVKEKSLVIDMTVEEFENLIDDEYHVLGIIRNNRKRLVVRAQQYLQQNDILIIEAAPKIIEKVLAKTKLELCDALITSETLKNEDTEIMEAVVPQASHAENHSSSRLRLRSRYQINLISLAREGKPFKERLNQVLFRAGDVVLLQGTPNNLQHAVSRLGLMPLEQRDIQITNNKKPYLPLIIFIAAIILAALQIMPVQVSFGGAVLVMLLTNIVSPRKVYDMIEWPIIILLAAMIPIGQALQSTGGTALIAHYLTGMTQHASPYIIIGALMVITMTLSDFMNNSATAVVMAPIAISLAQSLHMHIDCFLMAVAVGASCSFLTPVGHQNNTLVMGPGGYKFSDYIRIGLPLEIIVLVVSVPALLHYWPLH